MTLSENEAVPAFE